MLFFKALYTFPEKMLVLLASLKATHGITPRPENLL
jgi:hypothetical protein